MEYRERVSRGPLLAFDEEHIAIAAPAITE